MDIFLNNFSIDIDRCIYSSSLKRKLHTIKYEKRLKTLSSINNKKLLNRKINDKLGLRIIYSPNNNDQIAYEISDIAKTYYNGIIIRDYIKNPKEITNYKSLHVLIPYNLYGEKFIELQIRDELMHQNSLKDGYLDNNNIHNK